MRITANPSGRVDQSLVLGLVAVSVWTAWAWLEAGHAAWAANPLGLALVGLLGLGMFLVGLGKHATDPLRVAMLGLLVAFVGWNFLSILWADTPGDAWTGANKTAIYVVSFALFALWPISPGTFARILGAFALAVAGTAVIVLARATLAEDPSRFFVEYRLLAPTGYVNANVALWMAGLWPALHLGSRPDVPAALRGLFLAAATILVQVAVLGQTRAWLVALPVAAAFYLILQRQRLRAILSLAIVAGASLIATPALLAVYDDGVVRGGLPGLLAHATKLSAVSAAVAGIAGLSWAVLDSRITIKRDVARALGIAIAVLTLFAATFGTARAAAAIDDPRAWADEHWRDFTCSYCPSEDPQSRFTGTLSSDRYRAWSIAWYAFKQHPVTGIGADNFATSYLKYRTDPYFNPRYPHSLPLRILSQLGAVGALLLITATTLAFALALRARRRLESGATGAVAAALTVFIYWAVHGSGDWFWELPALAAPAFGLFGAASAASSGQSLGMNDERGERHARPRKRAFQAGLVVALAALTVSLCVTWLASSLERAAARTWVAAPGSSYSRLDLAARLNPLSADPLLLKGSIALKRHDWAVASEALHAAAEREPSNWYVQLQLGVLSGATGDFEEADQRLRAARTLNPLEPIAAVTQRLAARRVRLDPDSIDRLYLREAERLFDQPAFEHHRVR
jgi:tetratricopeptide (TPR) repeat protein